MTNMPRQDFPLHKVQFLSEFRSNIPIGFNVTRRHILLFFQRNEIQIIQRTCGAKDAFQYNDDHVWIYSHENSKFYVFHIHNREPGYLGSTCSQYPELVNFEEEQKHIRICSFLTSEILSQSDLAALIIRNCNAPLNPQPFHLLSSTTSTKIPVKRIEDDERSLPSKKKQRGRQKKRTFISVQHHPYYF